jgi:high affinity Mn2+ porin
MDLVSFTWGGLVELNQEHWALRAGYFLLPSEANVNTFDWRIPDNGQYLVEYQRHFAPLGRPGKVLLFGWLARGNMGSFADALAEPPSTPNYPDITLTRGHDRFNYGFALSAEQSITDALGMFARVSWSPEQVESMGWTDCGEALTVGATVKGDAWHRPQDTVGLAGLIEGLSPVARRYLEAGGMGIVIGDGTLAYRPEMVIETYYALTIPHWPTPTLDYQLVVDPGYNADRGPVSIFALRLHAAF